MNFQVRHGWSPSQGRRFLLLLLFSHATLLATTLAYKPLSDSFLKAIPSPGSDFDFTDGDLLAPILIPRVPGTPGQLRVQEFFVEWFRKELPDWAVEWQNSTSKTPVADDIDVPFMNIIFKREPPWVSRGQANLLTLAAHYDSKMTPEGFIGATDSAVPCAVLMHVARSIDQYLAQMYQEMVELDELGGTPEMDMGVQILLLDGEEAFVKWTDQDSLYGARSLAAAWESDLTGVTAMGLFPSRIDQISIFVLLDLLGSANPRIPSYFLNTHWAYKHMANIEDRMRNMGLLESNPKDPFFRQPDKAATAFGKSGVGDDHVPFMKRGVPILHLIPKPFPDVWHTMRDNGQNLDMGSTRDWAKIVTAFALEWLDMMEVWPDET
ncbi:putative glutaminyl-peptide cyclotransferase [Zalerion maritima]|uniref:Peptide hydrolase n=1 Tax=Zalerion maritima TaxID=339359 RepID=A0AAD5RZN5_9PEZI|nr:putative glutaminyl-peptide cyclotransferase [Zalerion maritima]